MNSCAKCRLDYDPVETPGGHCPRCLLAVGSSSGGGSAGDHENWEPPAIDAVQALLPRCEILELIGRGGMGAVYRARQPALDRIVAIKILPPLVDALGVGYVERFKNEARLLAKLNHPGIVHVYEFGELPGRLLHFVMEYVEGTDVARLVAAHGKLSPAQAASIAAEVCAALHCAHEAGVVHRDVKPANILVARDGRIKVADFGLAKNSVGGGAPSETTAGLVLGSADYAAPESLVAGMVVDHRADLYAVGVMLYYLLTGRVPRGVFPPASEKAPEAGVGFDRVIARAMQQAPERRYASAAAMRADIERAAAEAAVGQTAWRRLVWLVATAAGLVIVLTLLQPARREVAREPAPVAAPLPAKEIPNAVQQRAAAEWVLSKGGLVTLEGETERRQGYWTLPDTPFQISEIYFENVAPVGGRLTDADLALHLPQLPALRQFIIIQSPELAAGISETGARLLASYPEIRDLGLDGVRLGDETVRAIGAMPRLRTLLLSHSAIHGDSLRPSAERLVILSLTYCEIDDAAWKVIGAMPKLDMARFIGVPVNEPMIEALSRVKTLRRLGWRADPATEGALNRITEANPPLVVRRFETWNTTEPPPLRASAP